MNKTQYHIPALLNESIEYLNINPEGIYVDATFGGGGHSRAILEKLTTGKLVAFDRDPDAEKQARSLNAPTFYFVQDNYSAIRERLTELGIEHIDGVLADLGISSHQIDTPERGFSFRFDAPLDMRMEKSNNPHSASEFLSRVSFYELAKILKKYGEVPRAKRFARAILEYREEFPLFTTGDLVKAVAPLLPRKHEKKILSQIFQALRIHINDELEHLRKFLVSATKLLRPGGRFVVISYHSLEDRIVKRYFRAGNFEGEIPKDFYGNPQVPFKLITRKPITPSEEEIRKNPRSRSAKLRVAEKI